MEPEEPGCIHAPQGCCSSDARFVQEPSGWTLRYEYFLKASLANYEVGHVVSYFYPYDDSVYWVTPEASTAWISSPGRCVWSYDFTVNTGPPNIALVRPLSPLLYMRCTRR